MRIASPFLLFFNHFCYFASPLLDKKTKKEFQNKKNDVIKKGEKRKSAILYSKKRKIYFQNHLTNGGGESIM